MTGGGARREPAVRDGRQHGRRQAAVSAAARQAAAGDTFGRAAGGQAALGARHGAPGACEPQHGGRGLCVSGGRGAGVRKARPGHVRGRGRGRNARLRRPGDRLGRAHKPGGAGLYPLPRGGGPAQAWRAGCDILHIACARPQHVRSAGLPQDNERRAGRRRRAAAQLRLYARLRAAQAVPHGRHAPERHKHRRQ